MLHILEADGLTPPLKGTELASSLFACLDADGDGAVDATDAGYILGLLATGATRDRVDAACDAPGAPAGTSTVSRSQAVQQLQLCSRVRRQCGPGVVGLLLGTPPSEVGPMAFPSNEDLDFALSSIFGGASSVPAERFRAWAASTPGAGGLFTPLR